MEGLLEETLHDRYRETRNEVSSVKKKKSKKSRSRRRSSSESDSSDEDRRRRKSRKEKKKRRKRRRSGSPTESVSVYDPLTAASRIVKITKEEKARLLEVARKNALQMTGATKTLSKNDEIAIRAGGLTLEQLTEKCNDIAKGKIDVMDLLGRGEVELMNHPFDPRKQGEVDYNWAGEKDFTLHNNQRTNALAITAGKSKDELVREYPISAGVSHRKKEDALEDIFGKWEASNSQDAAADLAERMQRRSEMLGEDEGYFGNSWQPAPMGLGQKDLEDKGIGFNEQLQNPNGPNIILARGDEQVFDDPKNSYIMQEMDKLMKAKAELERQVQKAPNDLQLIAQMYTIEEKLQAWARKRDAPGEWSGGTDAPRLLTRDELEGQGKEAWATADMFEGAQEVQGVGRRLLEKMGWSDGQALGKLGVGDVEPLVIDFKLDRRGLNAIDEVHKGQKAKLELRASTQPLNILSGKHPVSAINEVCQKRRWPLPTWTTIESGHRWKMAIRVCEETYTPETFASTKKTAKMAAARVSLIEMGLIPADTPVGMECAALEAAGENGMMKF